MPATLQISVGFVTTGSVTITVQNGPTPHIRDYVALYLPGASTYFAWSYLNNGRTAAHRPPAGLSFGTVKFANLAIGNYEAKLFSLTDAGVATQLTTSPFAAALPASSGYASGYGIGPFGNVPWDVTEVPASAYTILSNGVIIPNIATVGWGGATNTTFFKPLNVLIDRVVVLENQ